MDTLRLILEGNVPLDLFASAVGHFSGMVAALSDEVADDEPVEWQIDYMTAGSAVVEVIAHSNDLEAVDRIVRAFDEVGESLSRKEPVPYSPTVAHHAHGLAGLLNGKITALALETRMHKFTVTEPTAGEAQSEGEKRRPAWGEVHGEIGAIIRRPRLQITVYDLLFDRGVPCFLNEQWQTDVNRLWGHKVVVTGLVYRDPITDRPVKVRDVVGVEILNAPAGDYRRARGVIPWRPGDEASEVTIRRLRDEP